MGRAKGEGRTGTVRDGGRSFIQDNGWWRIRMYLLRCRAVEMNFAMPGHAMPWQTRRTQPSSALEGGVGTRQATVSYSSG
jgi:hypothetical protein